MKTALFVILITESVLKEISTMGIPSNATETIPEEIVASEMISTYATEKTANDIFDTEKELSTYATTPLTERNNNERETTSAAGITLNATNNSENGHSTYATEVISNVTNTSENRHSTDAVKTNVPIDNEMGIPSETISNPTSVSDDNRLSTGGNLKPSLPKEPIIDSEIGTSSAPKKLRKGRVEKKIRTSTKATKKKTQVMIGRNNKKAMQAKLKEKANIPPAEDDTDSIQVSLDSVYQESAHLKKNLKKLTHNMTKPEKAFLRYGFQDMKHCQDYEKAFLCMRKCLDIGYDLANADKNCACTCRRNRMLHMHKQLIKMHSSTPWKGGAPTTSLPPWVIKQSSLLPKPIKNSENHDYEVYADVSFSHKSGEGQVGGGGDAGEAKNATEGSGEAKGDGEDGGAGGGEDDGAAKGDEDGNATPAEGEGGEGGEGEAGGEGGEGAEGAEGAEGGEGGEAAPAEEGEAAPAEEGEAAAEPEEEAPAEER